MMDAAEHKRMVRRLFENTGTIKRAISTRLHAASQRYPISQSQLELLFAVKHEQPASFKHLAQQLCVSAGAVSQLAEGLEEHQLVTREPDQDDRRIQCLSVSRRGAKLLQDIEKRRQRVMEAIVEGLTDEELAVWLRVQEKMIQHFMSDPDKQTKQEEH